MSQFTSGGPDPIGTERFPNRTRKKSLQEQLREGAYGLREDINDSLSAIRNIGGAVRAGANALTAPVVRDVNEIADNVSSGITNSSTMQGISDIRQGVNESLAPMVAGYQREASNANAALGYLAQSAKPDFVDTAVESLRSLSQSAPAAVAEAAAPAPEQVVREPQVSAIQSGQGDISDMANAARRERIKKELNITDEQFDQIREQNLNDRRAFRRGKAQGMEQIKALAQEVRAADQAGDTATAEALRNQILQIRQSIDSEGRRIGTIAQNLRGRISDLSPEEQTAASERTRAQLNAQLPTIAASARDQAKSAEQDQISRLADIGRRAYQLENGNLSDFAGMSDEAFAEYAQKQASPDAILRATRGVGLPPAAAPGAAGFADRVGSLSSIDFGRFSPSQPRSIDSQSLDAALQIAQQGGSNFNPLGGNAPTTTEQAPASDFQSVVRQQQQQTGVPIDSEAVASLATGAFYDALAQADADNNPETVKSLAQQLRAMAADPSLGQGVRDAAVRELVSRASQLDSSQSGVGAAASQYFGELGGPLKLIKSIVTGNLGEYGQNQEFAAAAEDLRKAIRTLNPSLFDSMTASE